MAIEGLLKVGIAVRSLEKATRLFTDVFGLTPGEGDSYEPHGMRYGVCYMGDVMLELIEPVSPDGPVARFIEKHSEGLQHMTLKVSNIEEVVSQLKAKGIQFVDDTPTEVEASFGRVKFVFVCPQLAHGTLIQLMELL